MAMGKGVWKVKASYTTTPLHLETNHVFHFVKSMLIFVQRYTHFRWNDTRKDVPQPIVIELEQFAINLIEKLFKLIIKLFLLCIKRVKRLHDSIEGLSKIGKMPFTTMGITKNFSTLLHINKDDTKLSYLVWFHNNESSIFFPKIRT